RNFHSSTASMVKMVVDRDGGRLEQQARRRGRIAMEPVVSKAQWLRHNLALNGCLDVIQVLEVALGNECGQVEIVLADDFLTGGYSWQRNVRQSRTLWSAVSQDFRPARNARSDLARQRANRYRQARH